MERSDTTVPDMGFGLIEEILRLLIFLGFGLVLLVGVLALLLGIGLTHPPRVSAGIAAARGDWIDPGDADLAFSEWVFHRPKGVTLPVWDIPVPTDRGRGKPIVIISHAWGGSKITSLQRVPFVYAEASRIVVWDMRGHGEAGGSSSHLGVTEIDDLEALINEVAGPDDTIILYGYSMGGGISICAALRDERVIGVIADGPYRWTAEPVRRLLRMNGLPEWPIVPIIYHVIGRLRPGFLGSERAQFAAQLKCPMLLMHGTHDPICPIDSAMEIAEVTPDCEFVVIPQAKHLDLHIVHPERYEKTINAFMRRCIAQARARTRSAGNLFEDDDAAAAADMPEAEASPDETLEIPPIIEGDGASTSKSSSTPESDAAADDADGVRPQDGRDQRGSGAGSSSSSSADSSSSASSSTTPRPAF